MQTRLLRALERVLAVDEIWYSIRRGVFSDLEWESDFMPTRQADRDEFARRVTAAYRVYAAAEADIDPRDVTPTMTEEIQATWIRMQTVEASSSGLSEEEKEHIPTDRPTRAAAETGISPEPGKRGPVEPSEQRGREEPRSSFRIPTSNRFSTLQEEKQAEEEEHREEEEEQREEEGEDQAERPRCRLCGVDGHTADQCPDMLTYARAAEDAQQPGASEEPTLRRLQPQFPVPREDTRAAFDSLAALDDISWDEVIAPSPFPTIKNVPQHVQGQLLDTMRQVLLTNLRTMYERGPGTATSDQRRQLDLLRVPGLGASESAGARTAHPA
jgi:hypothetical protein